MTAIRVRVPTPVRDVDPATLLLISHPLGYLQPYLPRDIDAELDSALETPGLVLIPSASFAGARRSAYEALLRNMPDALLISHDEPPLDHTDAAVVWADYHARGRGAARRARGTTAPQEQRPPPRAPARVRARPGPEPALADPKHARGAR